MKSASYSGTPLLKKLGIKYNFKIKLINAPEYYFTLFTDFPSTIKLVKNNTDKVDFIHFFTTSVAEMEKQIVALKNQLQPEGMIWVSWHKKTSNIPTNITENDIRHIALKNGLVDIKVCSVDEVWSALKLVIPVKDRNY